MDRNKLCLPVKHHIWEFICVRSILKYKLRVCGNFSHDELQEPPLKQLNMFLVSISGEFGWTKWVCDWLCECGCTSPTCQGLWSCFAAFRPELGVSFIQLLPHYLSSPSVAVPFSLFWVWREVTLVRQTVITALCPYVGLKSSVIHFKSTSRLLLFFPALRSWLQSIYFLSSWLSKIVCVFASLRNWVSVVYGNVGG